MEKTNSTSKDKNNKSYYYPQITYLSHNLIKISYQLNWFFYLILLILSSFKNNKSKRPMGIEPTTEAWEAAVLPLHQGRN